MDLRSVFSVLRWRLPSKGPEKSSQTTRQRVLPTPPFRIAVVCRGGTPFPQPLGGADVFALRQSIALAELGAEVVLVGPGNLPDRGMPPTLSLEAVPTTRTYRSHWRSLYYARAFALTVWTTLHAAAYLRRRPARVVHCHHSMSVILLRVLARKATVVYTVHDRPYSPLDKGQPFVQGSIRVLNNLVLEKVATRLSDGLFTVSSSIQGMVQAWGVPEGHCTLTPVIVLDSPSRPATAENAECLPAERATPYALSVGALTGRKRFDLLIRALAFTKPDRRLVIVGTGPLKERLVQLSKDLGVADRVTWLDSVFGEKWLDLIRGALFCVLASDREGNPTILLESLREGTPVVYIGSSLADTGIGGPYSSHLQLGKPDEIARLFDERWDYWSQNRGCRPEIQTWAKKSTPSSNSVASRMVEVYARLSKVDVSSLSPPPA